ncbi:MAG: Flp family type IVb pilin [Caulobacteraceae bacterium]
MKRFEWLLRGRRGATAVEYALIAALIALVIVAAVTSLGTNLSVKYNSISAGVAGAGS